MLALLNPRPAILVYAREATFLLWSGVLELGGYDVIVDPFSDETLQDAVLGAGNCRRDLLDHVIVLNERHLKRLLNAYILYYHDDRTHLALAKGTSAGREQEKNPNIGCRVVSMPRLGGLHHRYGLAA